MQHIRQAGQVGHQVGQPVGPVGHQLRMERHVGALIEDRRVEDARLHQVLEEMAALGQFGDEAARRIGELHHRRRIADLGEVHRDAERRGGGTPASGSHDHERTGGE
ncbi:hypothetical protein SDC9_155852 [bioreactor metagenome]|uniref:Uncharacterized protein n=1 Tax=bioreactor metagenome TaxID=1076179 RepID=A0A645F572_9ZZZZ